MEENVIVLSVPNTVHGAIEVMNNLHGTGKERKESLIKNGFDAVKVQKCVNAIIEFWED